MDASGVVSGAVSPSTAMIARPGDVLGRYDERPMTMSISS